MQNDGVTEILETLQRAGGEDAGQDVESRIKLLPRTNPDFEASELYGIVSGQLQAQLGEAVNEAVYSKELQFAHGDCVSPGAVDEVVARLVASPSFTGVVLGARACLQRAARLKNTAGDVPAAGAAAAVGGTTTKDERIHLHRNMSSSDDTDGEGMHAKKKALRRDDWVGTFSLGGGGAGRGFSPRIDVEAVLGQLEAGLGSPGGSATSATEALGLLAEADPELFQFGNHWAPFLELARRALRSADPAVHAKAMSLHWIMYEKSVGMSAADMCEGVLDHARHYFASTVHVLPFPAPNRRTALCTRGGGDCDTGASLAGSGNSELARAAREGRALHGMLATIHEAFQHLPEKRVWNIVSGFLCLFGDAAAAAASATGPLAENGDATATGANNDSSSLPLGADVDSGGSGGSSQVVLLPAHFLAIAGTVDDWLPDWLRALPTGRLVRAVNDAGLVAAMVRRCTALQPQVPFRPRRLNRPRRAEPAFGTALTGLGNRTAAFCPPLSAAAAVPPGDVIAPPATDFDRALLLQSVSFLGTIVAHCRGNPQPCPPAGGAAAAAGLPAGANGNEPPGAGCEAEPPGETAARGAAGEAGLGVDLEHKQKQQGEEVMQALARCVVREPPPTAELVGERMALLQPYSSRWPAPKSVRGVALGYIGQIARAAAGAASTPFTPTVIDVLFSPLAGGNGHWNGSGRIVGQAGDSGGGGGGGSRGSFRHSRFDGEQNGGPPPPPVGVEVKEEEEEEEPASFLRALAEIAGVLLSSRGGSTGFFVDGPAGPEASRALLEIARCAAELAKYACWRRSSSHGSGSGGSALGEWKENGAPGALGSADAWEARFHWLGRGDAEHLAVEFACALVPIMGYPPKQRAAGWAALWRCDVPHALAALTACLEMSPAPKGSASGKVEGGQRHSNRSSASTSLEKCSSGDGDECRSGGPGGDGSIGGVPCKRDCDLRDRLLLSLIEWARDLAGVSYLRRVRLARPCASFLSRYLARRYLRPACRDECVDPRPLALAARLSLCPGGLQELLCADGGISDEVDAGLGRLEELMDLAELLPSQTAAGPPLLPRTPRPHALSLAVGCTNSGFGGGDGGEGVGVDDVRRCSSTGGHRRLSGMEVGGGGGAPDLRCLEIAYRFSCPSTALPSSGCTGALRAQRWLQWAVSHAAPGEPLPDAGRLAPEEVAHAPEDVRVAALGLATSLASDLTVAVAMEARWSLADALAPQQPVEGAAGVAAVTSGSGAGIGSGGSSGGGKGGDVEAMVSESGLVSDQFRSGSRGGVMAVHIPDVLVPVEPVKLGCARLVISLTCLGGPTEERRNRIRRLHDAEAIAGATSAYVRGDAVAAATAAADAPDAHAVGVTSQHVRGDLRGMAQVAHFPEDSLSDKDWWSAARQCVSTIVAVLAKPRGPRTDEAFALLVRAAAKGPALPPGPAAAAPRAREFVTSNNRDGGMPRVSRSEGDMPRERPAVVAVTAAAVAAMEKLLFSYARGLGLVGRSDRDRFGAGMRRTLAAAEGVMSVTTSLLFPFPFPPTYCAAAPAREEPQSDDRSCGCDWFTAVVFLASGDADGAAARRMILAASRRRFPGAVLAHPPPSLAGKLLAADGAGAGAAAAAVATQPAAAAAVAGVAVRGSAGRAAVPIVGAPRAPNLPPVSTVSTTAARVLPPMTVTESRAADKEEKEEVAAGVGAGPGAGTGAGARAGVGAVAGAWPSPSYVGAAAAARASLGDPPLLLLAALAEEVVEEELPGVEGALRRAGWAVAPLAVRWMRQCMLCVVDWPGVVAYLALTLLRGHDYQVYFVVALLRTALPTIMDAASTGLYLHLGDLLAGGGSALDGFDLADALSYMEGLERRHRPRCLAATEAYLAQ